MTLAYTQVLQYCTEEATPLAPSKPHPLAMSVRELRWHIGKYTTFNKYDVFKGLGNALSGATVENTQPSPTETPPADSTTSSAMTDIEDTQPSLMGTPPGDSTISSAMTDIEDTQQSYGDSIGK